MTEVVQNDLGATTLRQFLSARCRVTPEVVAFLMDGVSVSVQDLERAAHRIAVALRNRGLAPGDRVGLLLDRSLQLPAAVFALMEARLVCVPLDPGDPEPRRAAALVNSGAKYVVTQRHLAERSEAGVTHLFLDDLSAEAPDRDLEEARPSDLAFIFYTSGTTGQPKGVCLTNQALVAGQSWLQRAFRSTPEDRHLVRSTISVTNLVREVFWPVLAGSAAVVVPPGEHRDLPAQARIVAENGVTILVFVPSMLQGMLSLEEFRACRSVRLVFCTSDVMPPDLPEAFFEQGFEAELYNLYGLTEALYAAVWKCRPGRTAGSVVPIGHPAELDLHVLDGEGRAVRAGEVGELHLSGTGMMTGYFGRDDLTRERFAVRDGLRLYRTGDLARVREDGTVELRGRSDDQFKVRGHRVDPAEIEAALGRHPGVEHAVVVGREEVPGHTRIIAYIVPASGAAPAPRELREFLRGSVPEHMLPAVFVRIEEVPLTHNGKVDRRALGSQVLPALTRREDYEPPRNESERTLAGIWQDVLRAPRVGIRDDFFEIGGDSILGVLIAVKSREAGLPVSPTQVFSTPTIAEMAGAVGSTDSPAAAPDAARTGGARPASAYEVFGWTPADVARIRSVLEAARDSEPPS